jgi:hypothetical protein
MNLKEGLLALMEIWKTVFTPPFCKVARFGTFSGNQRMILDEELFDRTRVLRYACRTRCQKEANELADLVQWGHCPWNIHLFSGDGLIGRKSIEALSSTESIFVIP